MRKLIVFLIVAIMPMFAMSQRDNLRKYLTFNSGTSSLVAAKKLIADSVIWFSPSYSIDFVNIETQTGAYKFGAVPGVGYGMRYKPKIMRKNYLCALDLYLQGSASDDIDTHSGLDYFNIDVLPVFSVANWFGIGYGLRAKVGLDGVPTVYRSVFTFGIRREF